MPSAAQKHPSAAHTPGTVPRILARFFLYVCMLVSALWLGWHLLAQVNFAYPLAYRLLHIDRHVAEFGPQNRYKKDFAMTTAREQKRLFGAIVDAIQNGGTGLRDIRYVTSSGNTQTLLREAEAIHLQDVANLIGLLNRVSQICLGGLALALGLMLWRRIPPPTATQMAAGLGVVVLVIALILLAVGPTDVFYWLHTKIFPDEHEWFFYYQDSLMTTLMKAPDLFGFVAALWGLLTLALFMAAHLAVVRSLARVAAH